MNSKIGHFKDLITSKIWSLSNALFRKRVTSKNRSFRLLIISNGLLEVSYFEELVTSIMGHFENSGTIKMRHFENGLLRRIGHFENGSLRKIGHFKNRSIEK